MEKQIEINGLTYVPKGSERSVKAASRKGFDYCIVRTYSAGVFAAYYDRKIKGKEATILDARRLWYWSGANSLSQLANDGVAKPNECKFAQIVPEIDLKEIIEVIPCTEKAKKSIESVKTWQQ